MFYRFQMNVIPALVYTSVALFWAAMVCFWVQRQMTQMASGF